MGERLPVVYVRGYAGSTSGIDKQVDDPFYGFNNGATHVRVDGDGVPLFYQFEGPLLRLMIDEQYRLLVHGGQEAYLRNAAPGTVEPASLWVYRFYDSAATTFRAEKHRSWWQRLRDDADQQTAAPGFDIEQAAVGLYDLVRLVLDRTGAPKVYLVAHSMGGLVARCMIQKVSRSGGRTPGSDLVAKLFTFGTPHGGIDFELGALDWAMETFGPSGADMFSPAQMYGYLTPGRERGDEPPAGWDPREIPEDAFPVGRVFCLVGTDPADYGLARQVVGPKSDGLVLIRNAYVKGAHRAFVHRSHSGRYGEVNSEEGYQNLRRFLFGQYEVRADLHGLELPPGPAGRAWQADVRLAVRGLPVVIHEQAAAHYCPVQLDEEMVQHSDDADAPVPLAGTYLLDPAHFRGDADDAPPPRARYTVTLRVFHLDIDANGFSFRHHLEQVPDWADTLIVDVGREDREPPETLRAWIAWNSSVAGTVDTERPITELIKGGGSEGYHFVRDGAVLSSDVSLPAVAREFLGAGARIRLSVREADTGV